MLSTELHNIITELENSLSSQGGNIGFGVTAGRSYAYEDQFDVEGQRPAIIYDAEYGLYNFTYGARLTPGKREYPKRYFNGELDGSQPEFFYTSVQQVDFAPIIERLSDSQYRVWPQAVKGWPTSTPFYIYLAQKDQGPEDENIDYLPTYRFVRVDGDVGKIKVTDLDYNTGIITIEPALILEVPAEDSGEAWDQYQSEPFVFAFFNYPIDTLLKQDLVLIAGDETHPSLSLTGSTTITSVDNFSTFTINVVDVYDQNNVYLSSDIPDPVADDKILIILRAESGTIISYKEVEIVQAQQVDELEVLTYDPIDPSDPFYNIDIVPVQDPFEDTSGEGLGPNQPEPPTSPAEPTGKLVYRQFVINIKPYVSTLAVGNDFSYFEKVEAEVSKISDEELSVPLHATAGSLRPHTFHTLDPMKAPAYADTYNFNWAAPLPYPEKTFVEDCDEPVVNGYLTPEEISKKRLSYRRNRNSWFIGGTVFCICRNFIDANSVEDCIVNRNFQWYFKLRGIEGVDLYHIAFSTWQ